MSDVKEKGPAQEEVWLSFDGTKPVVLYIDDKRRWLNEFETNHSSDYHLVLVQEAKDFEPTLKKMIASGHEPDIILIDLFLPKHNDKALRDKFEIPGNDAIDKLEATIQEVRVPIFEAWEPYGVDMLRNARKLLKDAPIIIYTQQGVSVVKDDQLREVSELHGEWLLKGRDSYYESMRISALLEAGEQRKLALFQADEKRKREVHVYTSVAIGMAVFVCVVALIVSAAMHQLSDIALKMVMAGFFSTSPKIAELYIKFRDARKTNSLVS